MKVQLSDFASDPRGILSGGFDCVWVALSERRKAVPLASRALQWIDWKLQGQISRLLVDENNSDCGPLVLHSMGKVGIPFVVLEFAKSCDWELMERNCAGLKAKKVLLFVEDFVRASSVEREIAGRSWEAFPETMVVGYESSVSGER